MNKFKFYHIEEKYINYLKNADPRVQHNKGQRRPYVGIVLAINNCDYYVPLESPKPNHKNIRSGGPVLKLDNGKLGIIGFNNMIPVVPSCLIAFDIQQVDDEKYRYLLLNQLSYCNRHSDIIFRRAKTTYEKQVSGNVPLYKKICCNFRKLERKSKKYDPDFKPKQKVAVSSKQL